jgi:hypothetical protein
VLVQGPAGLGVTQAPAQSQTQTQAAGATQPTAAKKARHIP